MLSNCYDCSALHARDSLKCYRHNKVYNIGDKLDDTQLKKSCIVGCECSLGHFTCGHIDCPQFFGNGPEPPKEGCVEYGTETCCENREVCGKELESIEKCQYQGKTYYEDQSFEPKDSCYTCVCQKGFEDKPAEENKHCRKIDCKFELLYSDRFLRGCIPVYWETDTCCPIDWRCPSDEPTKVIAGPNSNDGQNFENTCVFGDLRMNIGDTLTPETNRPDDNCRVCTCKVPPYAHCIQTCN
ncbi:CLUMA_CG011014, isoform A [Clunio marinus]|uniref:CLUMA_CG011014, isoform A n=1 Tax=Clunio marinus TaxID=568069 RepID=A0A1J1IDK1_9DIPT|nr:CLUMA_CG011014, isoform A [Clunio marinus]